MKLDAIAVIGGKCSVCGYSKNLSALHFHHKDPSQKDFTIASVSLSDKNFKEVLNEISKCILLCANCHAETHYPDMDLDTLKNSFVPYKEREFIKDKEKICACGNPILDRYSKGTRCRTCAMRETRKVKERPSKDELKNLLIDSNYERVGRMFGVAGRTIRNWLEGYEKET